jgi:protein-S-isoprenylcysteine O-methyltransferase Ste14
MEEVFFVSGYWFIYFLLHSILATNLVKEKIEINWPFIYRYYRIFYNVISMFGLIYILFYLATTPSGFVFAKHEYLQFTGLALSTWGLIILKQSFKHYSIREFLGLQTNQATKNLVIGGLLNHVRHPLYSGTILIVGGLFLFNPKVLILVTLVCVVIYILIGIQLEERKLENEFGEEYREYKKKVGMLVPRWQVNN